MLKKEEEKMFEAVQKKDNDYFKQLPENVNINTQDVRGDTLLHKLVKTGFVPSALPCILKRNPNPFIENNDGMTPRMLAVWRGATSQAAFLAAYEASYTEKQRRFQVKCQAEVFEALSDMIHCNNTVWTRDEIYNIADRMRRGANERAD